jgi:hypothetical protein
MKKYLSIILVALLVTGLLFSCKKRSDSKDFTAVIKNKTWWGQLTTSGETAQYYSVYFNGDGSLLWSQRAGGYTGKWTINDNQLTMDFLTPAVQKKANISDDNTLKNIVTNNSTVVNSGEMIANPTTLLDNTVWKGMISLTGGIQEIFHFTATSKVSSKTFEVTNGFFRISVGQKP